IDGVEIQNTVAMNSYIGSLYTDKGPWAEQTAAALGGKIHGLCARHEANNIPAASTGQENYDACFKGRTSMVQRRPVNGQERGGRKSSTKRANPLLGRLQALGRSRGVQSRSDGVGDFNIPGYESSLCDLKPEGVPAETAAIESHNIPRDGQDPSAI
ncbi:hypothetical protein THAOC_29498, partial [Thalassiosira oceanica]